jgi:preprotein translocase subunit SecA
MESIQNHPDLRTRVSRFVDGLRGRPVEWNLSSYRRELESIDALARELRLDALDDAAIRERARELAARANRGAERDELRAEAFALAREAAERALGMRPYDVQMLAALALDRGRVVEMQTGEGKTLLAVLPAFLGALDGRGVHVLTFNDYLAGRDAAWMGPVYELLGLEVGYLVQGSTPEERRRAYGADVTYVTAREAGYDYLRQGLARDPSQLVQRPFHLAIVDEADSIMIDEARIPLVIAGIEPGEGDRGRARIAALVAELEPGRHFAIDEHGRNAFLTGEGADRVQRALGCGDLQQERNRELATELNQALHAHALLRRDVDYIVRDGRVEVVDEFTGRVVRDRHWPDGLHRAVEAKEGLDLKNRGRVLGSITMQHLLGLYPRLCGMTGTAIPSERELEELYQLDTVVIPPNRPCVRIDREDRLFTHKEAKQAAVVAAVVEAHRSGRPVLIGTASVEESEQLAAVLELADVDCSVLNAQNDEREAEIVAEAGAVGAVTVSTNMAGRGTDIKLGGADEREREQIVALGGLLVIGTNRHESRRIDDQLRGRAGRQGDPGESRFIISLEDDLMTRFGAEKWIPRRHRAARRDEPLDDPVIHGKIELTQRIIEGQNLEIRRTLWNYTSFVEKQRLKLQERRRAALEGRSAGAVAALCPTRYEELARRVSRDVLEEAERQISLFHIDRAWADHLAAIADIREGIYLTRLGGRDPLHEFFKLASAGYERLEQAIDEGVRQSFERSRITAEGIDLDREGLRGPSSTWTYLVNDNPFEWVAGLSAPGNIGLGVGAGVWGGLFVLKAVIEKLFGRKRRDDVS